MAKFYTSGKRGEAFKETAPQDIPVSITLTVLQLDQVLFSLESRKQVLRDRLQPFPTDAHKEDDRIDRNEIELIQQTLQALYNR